TNGLIAITTGNIDSLNAKARGSKWRQIHPPTHLHYFSRRTLTALLNKYGFDVIYVGYPGIFRSMDDIAYIVLSLKNNMPKLYRLFKNMGLLNWNIYLNTFDFIYIIGKKR
ncbi:MAG: methyltransferase domain-containing protein, partial [Candidatus Margulisiibacteriota bacterium]